MKYGNKTREAAQKEIDKIDKKVDWALANIKIGDFVKFDSRSSRYDKRIYREIMLITDMKSKYSANYPNPNYVPFETTVRWAQREEWDAAHAKWKSDYPAYLTIYSRNNRLQFTSKNRGGRYEDPINGVIVADNNVDSLKEVMIDDKWVKISDLLKTQK